MSRLWGGFAVLDSIVDFVWDQAEREPQLCAMIVCLAGICAYLVYLLTTQKYRPKEPKLTRAEQDSLIAEWRPVPLAPALTARMRKRVVPVVESACDTHVVIGGKRHLNLSAMNFLGIANDPEMKAACRVTVDKYGVGSCGPRGFYGTIDTHLDLEAEIAKFYGTKDAILYSDGFQTIASAIPAFAKKGDILICDEAVNFAVQSGCSLSRATIQTFKHNDMEDLERILKQIKAQDDRKKVREIKNRRFIVIEGLYQNYGDIAPLAKIIALRHKYKYRLIVDDTLALGVLGETGKGSWQHWQVPVTEIEILCAGLDAAVASIGGYCVGTPAVVDHQRLSGAGYCFSASAPPYTSTASIHSLRTISSRPDLIKTLHANAARVRRGIAAIPGVEVKGDSISPLIHIHLAKSRGSYDADVELFDAVAEELLSRNIVVQVSQYLASERRPPMASMKVFVSAAHTETDLDEAVTALTHAFGRVLRE